MSHSNCGQDSEGTGIHSFVEALKEIGLYTLKTVDLSVKRGGGRCISDPRAAALRSSYWL